MVVRCRLGGLKCQNFRGFRYWYEAFQAKSMPCSSRKKWLPARKQIKEVSTTFSNTNVKISSISLHRLVPIPGYLENNSSKVRERERASSGEKGVTWQVTLFISTFPTPRPCHFVPEAETQSVLLEVRPLL